MWRLRLGQAAICSGLPILAQHGHSANMETKSRDYIYGSTIRVCGGNARAGQPTRGGGVNCGSVASMTRLC
jgi:hypothetical protein